MVGRKAVCLAVSCALVAGMGVGCEDLPGSEEEQGAVIGGVTGAAAGALIGGDDNALIGALIGGAVGAGGGYLIGSQLDNDEDDQDEATKASDEAQKNPATAEQARRAQTADINDDGYVTMDEVVALDKAGFSDDEIIERLDRTDMFFDLSSRQQQYLRDNGVSDRIVSEINTVNPDVRRKAEERAREKQTMGSQSVGKTP